MISDTKITSKGTLKFVAVVTSWLLFMGFDFLEEKTSLLDTFLYPGARQHYCGITLFFTDQEIKYLKEKAQIIGNIAHPRVPEFITLDSVIYNAYHDWQIWVNGHRFIDSKAVKIVEVSSEAVTFLIKLRWSGEFPLEWHNTFHEHGSKIYRSSSHDILIDLERNWIIFSLKPGETFIFEDLAIAPA